MFLEVNVYNLCYTTLFLIMFCICYFVVVSTRLEELFKKNMIWQIRVAQAILAIIFAYLATQGIMSLVNNF